MLKINSADKLNKSKTIIYIHTQYINVTEIITSKIHKNKIKSYNDYDNIEYDTNVYKKNYQYVHKSCGNIV
jgi:hypothetical protein